MGKACHSFDNRCNVIATNYFKKLRVFSIAIKHLKLADEIEPLNCHETDDKLLRPGTISLAQQHLFL